MENSEIKITIRSFDSANLFEAQLLTPNEVQIWHGSIAANADDIRHACELLDADEKERAQRFHFDRHRNRYMACRAMLRKLVACQLGITPAAVRFQYTKFGKPFLEAGMGDLQFGDLQFNVSHSEGYGAIALAWGRRVGVDVERVRDAFNAQDLADRFFSQAEKSALRELTEPSIAEAFFRCWTRKEAYIKARGEGLSHPLDGFDVSLDADPENALLHTRPDPAVASLWLLRGFAAQSGYVAAVAVEREPDPGTPSPVALPN